jgi:hypothetical protein
MEQKTHRSPPALSIPGQALSPSKGCLVSGCFVDVNVVRQAHHERILRLLEVPEFILRLSDFIYFNCGFTVCESSKLRFSLTLPITKSVRFAMRQACLFDEFMRIIKGFPRFLGKNSCGKSSHSHR